MSFFSLVMAPLLKLQSRQKWFHKRVHGRVFCFSLGYVSYCSFFLLEIALFWKSLPFIKNTLGKWNSPKHIPREPPPPLSGQWGRWGGQCQRFCLSNVFPYCYRTCFACSWEQLHGARVFIKQVHSRFDRKIRIDSTVENTMCNLEYSTTVSQLFANGERSVFY